MSRKAQQLIDLLEPTVESLGYQLIDLEYNASSKHGLLRLYIGHPDGITVDDCQKVSHQVSGILDVEDPIKSEYDLEVSSPGVDRILRTTAHYEEFMGSEVNIRLKRPEQNRRKLTGVIMAVSDKELSVEVEGETMVLNRENIDKTRLVPVFDV
ncbi:MAG: ribosome maturation factor RimP [Gammaproteobacteria bacterium]